MWHNILSCWNEDWLPIEQLTILWVSNSGHKCRTSKCTALDSIVFFCMIIWFIFQIETAHIVKLLSSGKLLLELMMNCNKINQKVLLERQWAIYIRNIKAVGCNVLKKNNDDNFLSDEQTVNWNNCDAAQLSLTTILHTDRYLNYEWNKY